jgi:hypothetical protein
MANPEVTAHLQTARKSEAITMILEPTVFILGAGASWHYGYPTGEKLVDSVISMAERLKSYCDQAIQVGGARLDSPQYVTNERSKFRTTDPSSGWRKVRDDCGLIIDRLKAVRPLVIDHFLEWNHSLRDIGRLLIAGVILECEARWLQYKVNQNRSEFSSLHDHEVPALEGKPDPFIRFIVHKLMFGCKTSSDLLKNTVKFIVFNYDTTLEFHLARAFSSLDLITHDDGDSFLRGDRIVHVYGTVRQKDTWTVDEANRQHTQGSFEIDHSVSDTLGETIPFQNENTPIVVGLRNRLLDQFYEASKHIRTIDPHDKEENDEALNSARRHIEEGVVFYILGYGFEPTNSRRIGLDLILRSRGTGKPKQVMFTNFQDNNVINKRASNLFVGEHDTFSRFSVDGQPFALTSVNNVTSRTRQYYVEKSVRTAYEALAMDFDALEGDGLS